MVEIFSFQEVTQWKDIVKFYNMSGLTMREKIVKSKFRLFVPQILDVETEKLFEFKQDRLMIMATNVVSR